MRNASDGGRNYQQGLVDPGTVGASGGVIDLIISVVVFVVGGAICGALCHSAGLGITAIAVVTGGILGQILVVDIFRAVEKRQKN